MRSANLLKSNIFLSFLPVKLHATILKNCDDGVDFY